MLAGSPHRFGDYKAGEKIDHVVGITVEDAEHMIATRLYQNTARIHFDHFTESKGRFGHRLIYGGHAISLARALSFNGLANAFHVAAINGGRHVAPLFAGLTVFAWSEVLATAELPGRNDVGALRLRTVATKDRPCADFPLQDRRRVRPGGHPRSRLLGADAEVRRRPDNATIKKYWEDAVEGEMHVMHKLHETEERLLTELRTLRRSHRAGPRDAFKLTLGQRIADDVAATMGSWTFIIIQSGLLFVWIALNITAYVQPMGPLSIHPAQSCTVVPSRLRGALHHDEPEPAAGHRPQGGRARLPGERKGGA